MDFTLDIMADGNFDQDQSDQIEFFYTHGTMACPIEGCQVSHFASKTKYQRHWDEQHVQVIVPTHAQSGFASRYADDAQI